MAGKKKAGSHRRPSKKVLRAQRNNDLQIMRLGRKVRNAVSEGVYEAYCLDEVRDNYPPALTLEEINDKAFGMISRTDVEAEAFRSVIEDNCHEYMKKGVKDAIDDVGGDGGVPCVMVNSRFFDVDPDDYLSEDRLDVLKKWLAGCYGKAAGVLYIYEDDETANLMYQLCHDALHGVGTGIADKSKAMAKTAADKALPDYSEGGRLENKADGLPNFPRITDESMEAAS